MPPRRVFLSYSHDSDAHRDRVLRLADRLRADGLDAWIDQYDGHQDHWPRWIQNQIDRADTVLVVCTETYRRRFEGHETDGGHGADWEGRLLIGELYRRNTGTIVAVVFTKADIEHLPRALRDGTWYSVGSESGYEALLRHLTNQPVTPPPPVGRQKLLPAKRRHSPVPTVPVGEAAEDSLASVRSTRPASMVEVLLVHGIDDLPAAETLAQALRDRAFSVEMHSAEESRRWDPKLDTSRYLVFAVGAGSTEWHEVIDSLHGDSLSPWVVQLPGDPRPAVPDALSELDCFDLVHLDDVDEFCVALRGRGRRLNASGGPPRSLQGEPSQRKGRFREPLIDMEFLAVPAGRYRRGSNSLPGVDEEYATWVRPEHWVRVSRFWMARTPVTNHQYSFFLEANPEAKVPAYWQDRRFEDLQQPVVGVSWKDAKSYCRWLTSASGTGFVFSLPTEAQWEFAARGETSAAYPWGNDEPTAELVSLRRDYEREGPDAVGAYPLAAGPFGHLDLASNVWEWCADAWESSYGRWANLEPLDPIGEADTERRPLRGGSWVTTAGYQKSVIRQSMRFDTRSPFSGFRLAADPRFSGAPPSLPTRR